jgi:2-haloalkanoic acid dehalogenase type II
VKPTVCTFDCYGTLVDWEGGAASFLYDLCLRHGEADPPPGHVLRSRWEALQFAIVSDPEYRPYKQVLAESLEALMNERGMHYEDGEGYALIRSMRSWQPFPDTRPALTQVRENGVRLVIVSNTDHDIIEHTLRQLDVPFDDVVTAEDARAYKPSETVFRTALEKIGEPPENILHVAFGFKYDLPPANALGMGTAWINRHREPPPGDAHRDHEWRDLWGLAELVNGERASPSAS